MSIETHGKNFAHLAAEHLSLWPHLSDDERVLLPVLMSYQPTIKPAVKTLAKAVAKSERAVRSTLQRMCRRGLLIVVRPGGGRFTTEFRIADVADEEVWARLVRPPEGNDTPEGNFPPEAGFTPEANFSTPRSVLQGSPEGNFRAPLKVTAYEINKGKKQEKRTSEIEAADAAAADAAPIVAVEVVDTAATATLDPACSPDASEQVVTILLPATSTAPIDEVDWSEFDDGQDVEDDEADGDDWDYGPPPDEAQPVLSVGIAPAPTPAPSGPRRKVKRVRRTTDREELVRQSFENLVCWLAYGVGAVGTPMHDWATLEPAAGNWFDDGVHFGDANQLPSPALDDLRLASWAWYELNRARADAGLGVLLYEGSLLGKDGKSKTIGSLITTRGKAEAIRIVRCMSEHYSALCEAVKARWATFLPPALDERYFSHPELIKEAERLLSAPPQLPGTYNLAI